MLLEQKVANATPESVGTETSTPLHVVELQTLADRFNDATFGSDSGMA